MRILLVEDDAVAARYAEAVLAERGHRMEWVKDGALALARYLASPFDAVVTDMAMPRMDGLELVRRLRQHPGDGYTYMLLLFSRREPDDVQAAFEAGVDDCLAKPYHPAELLGRMRVAARLRQLRPPIPRRQEIIRMCAYCQRVHDAQHGWLEVERLVTQRTGVAITHGCCPDCYHLAAARQGLSAAAGS